MTWKNRWPTVEEARAHAETHGPPFGSGLYGRSLWMITFDEPHLIPRVIVIRADTTVEVLDGLWVHVAGQLTACHIRPIDLEGNPVLWPGEKPDVTQEKQYGNPEYARLMRRTKEDLAAIVLQQGQEIADLRAPEEDPDEH